MTMQSDGKHHSLNNLWAQLALSAAVIVIVMTLAWRYVW